MRLELLELFLGGFASGFLARGFIPDYGLYATLQRLIGVDVWKVDVASFLGGNMAGLVNGQLMPTLSPEEDAEVIQELD